MTFNVKPNKISVDFSHDPRGDRGHIIGENDKRQLMIIKRNFSTILNPNKKDPRTHFTHFMNQRTLIEHPSMSVFIFGAVGSGKTIVVKYYIELFLMTFDKKDFKIHIFSSSGSTFNYETYYSKPLYNFPTKDKKTLSGKIKQQLDKKNKENRLEFLVTKLKIQHEKYAKYKKQGKKPPIMRKRLIILDDVLDSILHGDITMKMVFSELIKNRYAWNLTIIITSQVYTGIPGVIKSQFDFSFFLSDFTDYEKRTFNGFLTEAEKYRINPIFKDMVDKSYGVIYKRPILPRGARWPNCTSYYKQNKKYWWKNKFVRGIFMDILPNNNKANIIKMNYKQYFEYLIKRRRNKYSKYFKDEFFLKM